MYRILKNKLKCELTKNIDTDLTFANLTTVLRGISRKKYNIMHT